MHSQHIPQQGRQTLFYTATWPKEVRRLASEFLTSPCIVYIGDTDKLVANKDITQAGRDRAAAWLREHPA